MLVDEPSWFKLVFRLRQSELKELLPRIVLFTAVAAVVTVAFQRGLFDPNLSVVPFTLVGLPLGVFIGFRSNRAHDRYWEARIQWGNLVNCTRTFARQLCHLTRAPQDEQAALDELRRRGVKRTIAFVYALRAHLSGDPPPGEIESMLGAQNVPGAGEKNVPQAVLRGLTPELSAAVEANWLHPMHLPELEVAVTRMTDVQGACERIKNTPLPVPFTGLTHRLVALYCVGLPFGLVETLAWMTIPVCAFIAYAFIGLESIAEEIERPFAPGPNQLPLLTMSRTIHVNLQQTLGDAEGLPEIPVAADGVLP